QRRGFERIEMSGHAHGRGLVDAHELAQDAVDGAPEAAHRRFLLNGALDPIGDVRGAHSVADTKAADFGADRDDLARAVREGDERGEPPYSPRAMDRSR